MRLSLIGVCIMGLCACAPKPEEHLAAPEANYEELGQDAPGTEGPLGWLNADAPGETAAMWRAGPNAVEFSLTCVQAEKSLAVHAEAPAMKVTQNLGAIVIGPSVFPATVSAIEDSVQIELKTEVTPALLKALATQKTARITIGADSTATEPDDKNALAHLSSACATLTGIAPE